MASQTKPDEGPNDPAKRVPRSARLKARGVPYMGETEERDEVRGLSSNMDIASDPERLLDSDIEQLVSDIRAKRSANNTHVDRPEAPPKRPRLVDRMGRKQRPSPGIQYIPEAISRTYGESRYLPSSVKGAFASPHSWPGRPSVKAVTSASSAAATDATPRRARHDAPAPLGSSSSSSPSGECSVKSSSQPASTKGRTSATSQVVHAATILVSDQTTPVSADTGVAQKATKAGTSSVERPAKPQDASSQSMPVRSVATEPKAAAANKVPAHESASVQKQGLDVAPSVPAPARPASVKSTDDRAKPGPAQPEPAPPPPRSSPFRVPVPPVERPVFPPLDTRSAEFWYPDGNIIIKVEGTYFNLLRSRLERHCDYFKRVIAERAWATVSGQKVAGVGDLKLHDFEVFLKYLEVPMEHSVKDASKDSALCLLRASRILGCKVIGDLAEKRAFTPWASADIPATGDKLIALSYREAVRILGIARDLQAPLVQKQALYALLSNDQFWTDAASQRTQVNVSDADLLMLYRTRAILQEKWRVHALTPPTQCQARAGCLADGTSRDALWWGQMAKHTTTEARDPLRSVNAVKRAVKELPMWCKECIDERVRAWEDARSLWWKELDQLLGIAAVPEVHA